MRSYFPESWLFEEAILEYVSTSVQCIKHTRALLLLCTVIHYSLAPVPGFSLCINISRSMYIINMILGFFFNILN